MLKIYPCLVTEGSKLHELWQKGEYEPYTTEEAVDLIVKVKKSCLNGFGPCVYSETYPHL